MNTNQTAYNDQMRAARTEALKHLANLASVEHAELSIVGLPPGSWLRDQAAGVISNCAAGMTSHCPHITSSPRVAFAAAWKPGHYTCPACLPQLRAPRGTDHTCDECGHNGDDVTAQLIPVGPILLMYGHCHTCTEAVQTVAPVSNNGRWAKE
jgi:hypothetical protein